jgi:hypothetical protein
MQDFFIITLMIISGTLILIIYEHFRVTNKKYKNRPLTQKEKDVE